MSLYDETLSFTRENSTQKTNSFVMGYVVEKAYLFFKSQFSMLNR